jgi:hypothetical protein
MLTVIRVATNSLVNEPVKSTYLTALGLPRQALLALTASLFEAFEISLTCATWMFRPQMRVLYALLVGMPHR